MSMVADSAKMMRRFEDLDCCTKDVLVKTLNRCTFTYDGTRIWDQPRVQDVLADDAVLRCPRWPFRHLRRLSCLNWGGTQVSTTCSVET
jgi:hypothetical protein